MRFELIGAIREVETIAIGRRIRELARLQRIYGRGRWRKRKGKATIELDGGAIRQADLHWYEARHAGAKDQAFP